MKSYFLLTALLAAGCASESEPNPPLSDASSHGSSFGIDAAASNPPIDSAAIVDTGTDEQASPWAEVEQIAKTAVVRDKLPGLGIVIRDAMDRTVFTGTYGDFALDRSIAVASASKLVSGTVLLELVRQGTLALDSTTGAVLGWPASKGSISLRHLLSFTSGLKPDVPCLFSVATTLAACVENIRDADRLALPGVRFDYGGSHLHVAGRMAEVAAGQSWKRLFDDIVARPLGLGADTRYVTLPLRGLGQQNPLIGGGLRITTLDYMEILALYFHKGRYRGLEVATPALFDQAAREPYPMVDIETAPASTRGRGLRYGLASWLHCASAADGCAMISSPGAFGFTPWVDRSVGYYAVIAMELSKAEDGVVDTSVDLQEELAPAIAAALGR